MKIVVLYSFDVCTIVNCELNKHVVKNRNSCILSIRFSEIKLKFNICIWHVEFMQMHIIFASLAVPQQNRLTFTEWLANIVNFLFQLGF